MRAAGSLPRAALRLLLLALLSFGAGEATAFGAAVRWGRADLAEVCCCSDSVLSGEVERLGGRTLRYSHWNGFDLSTDKGYQACAVSLRAERPRWTWFAPPCTMDSQLQHLNDYLNSVMKALAAFERKIGDSVAAAEALATEFGFPLPA